jgi:hypothetical protein
MSFRSSPYRRNGDPSNAGKRARGSFSGTPTRADAERAAAAKGYLSKAKIDAFVEAFLAGARAQAKTTGSSKTLKSTVYDGRSSARSAKRGRAPDTIYAGDKGFPTRASSRSTTTPRSLGIHDGKLLTPSQADNAFHGGHYPREFRAQKLFPRDPSARAEYESGWMEGLQIAMSRPEKSPTQLSVAAKAKADAAGLSPAEVKEVLGSGDIESWLDMHPKRNSLSKFVGTLAEPIYFRSFIDALEDRSDTLIANRRRRR